MATEKESFLDLLDQATQMLMDRTRPEADLIYYVAKMEDDLRQAIILSYQILYEEEVL